MMMSHPHDERIDYLKTNIDRLRYSEGLDPSQPPSSRRPSSQLMEMREERHRLCCERWIDLVIVYGDPRKSDWPREGSLQRRHEHAVALDCDRQQWRFIQLQGLPA